MNPLELTGRARTHVVELQAPRCALHYAAATSFLAMRDAAAQSGIDLVAASSFRDFDRQLAIWNAKWRGERPLLDRAGLPLDAASLDAGARIDAILCWSALPGGSRHHWGTDCDVIDAAALPQGYRVQLVPEEYVPGGVFARLTPWLRALAGQGIEVLIADPGRVALQACLAECAALGAVVRERRAVRHEDGVTKHTITIHEVRLG